VTGESLYPRDLIERLRAELDRLEAIARDASCGPWVVGSSFGAQNTRVFQQGSLIDSVGQAVFQAQVSNSPQCRENAAYIVANGPDVALRTIQAHRAILDEAVSWWHEEHEDGWYSCGLTESCINDLARGSCTCGLDARREVILRALASIYFPESDG